MKSPWPDPLDPGEVAAFEALRPRLTSLWREVFPKDDQHYTSVVVPSITIEPALLERRPELHYSEEVLLLLLIRLRNPKARIIYVTSQPVPPLIVDYYLQFLSGIPAAHAASRIRLFSVFDSSPRPLTEKILARPRLIARIRAALFDPSRAYLTVARATDLERRLAVRLGLPLNAADPRAERVCSKSSIRGLLEEAGIPLPLGLGGLRDGTDLAEAFGALRRLRPSLTRAVVKLDSSFLSEGRALVAVPSMPGRGPAVEALLRARMPDDALGPEDFLERFERTGGVVEEFVEAPCRADASVQLRINPLGSVFLTSTHDEVRGGRWGLDAEGCRFPASDEYRGRLQELGLRIAGILAERGVFSRLSIDFLLRRPSRGAPWELLASKVGLGVGGATHPLLAVRLLCGGRLDKDGGSFLSASGRPKYYRCTDRLQSDSYRQLTPEDVIELMTERALNYNAQTERGALFYMLGGVSATGRLGMVAIGNSREEAEGVFSAAASALDAACSAGTSVKPG